MYGFTVGLVSAVAAVRATPPYHWGPLHTALDPGDIPRISWYRDPGMAVDADRGADVAAVIDELHLSATHGAYGNGVQGFGFQLGGG